MHASVGYHDPDTGLTVMDALNVATLSRVVLALACVGSAVASGILAWVTHPKYTPHLILVSFWSLWAGGAMLTLAFERLSFPLVRQDLLIVNLNGAFIVTVGGWAFLGMRLWREARSTAVTYTELADQFDAVPTPIDIADALHVSVDSSSTISVSADSAENLDVKVDTGENLTATWESKDE